MPHKSGRKEVAAAGTPEPLSDTSFFAKTLDITAFSDNTAGVVVGSSEIVETEADRIGTPLNPGDTKTYFNVDLLSVYVDAEVNDEGVTYDAS